MDSETLLLAMLNIAGRTDGDPETRKAAMDELLKQSQGQPQEAKPEQKAFKPSLLAHAIRRGRP